MKKFEDIKVGDTLTFTARRNKNDTYKKEVYSNTDDKLFFKDGSCLSKIRYYAKTVRGEILDA